MKQINLTLILTMLMSIVGLNASAHDIEVMNADGVTIYYDYINNKTELAVTHRGSSYSSYSNEYTGNVVIPKSVTYNGATYSVTRIGTSAFVNCSGLTSITIPSSVTRIDDYAFVSCSMLNKVIVPNFDAVAWAHISMGYSSSNPLYYAHHLYSDENTEITEITIPSYVTTINKYTFWGFSGTVNINSNAIVSRTYSLSSSLKDFFGTSARVYIIGDNVTSIGDYAFYDTYLKSVTIGTGVLSIEKNAFGYSSGNGAKPKKVIWLTNTPPSGYKNAEGTVNYVANDLYTSLSNKTVYPFLSSMFEVGGIKYVPVSPSERTCDAIDCAYDSSAENVTISSTVNNKGISLSLKQIQPYVCYGNQFIKNVTVESDYTGNVPSEAFHGCTKILSVNVSNNGHIGESAFYGCTALQTAIISNNGNIGASAFYGCSNLQDVSLGKEITSIGGRAFCYCRSLQSIVIPDATTSLGTDVFYECSKMTSASIGSGLTTIPTSTFGFCSALNDIQIGQNVRTIDTYAFQGCSSLPTIVIPKSVTAINNYAFRGCSKLAKVTMSDREDDTELKLASNGSNPIFNDCPLKEVYIGRNISYSTSSNYGYSPFYRNTSLRSVTITDRETEISPNEFYGCTNLKEVKIGDGVTTIGNWAFSGCSSLDYFSFGSAVETIGQEAFSDCTAMTKLISKAVTPPTCDTQALDDINKWNCTLQVPAKSLSLYQAAPQWKEFFFIEEATGIKGITGNPPSSKATITSSYDLNGKQFSQPQKGLNILRMSDGTTRKIVK